MAGDISPAHRAAFKDMLVVCQMRGRDSTGAFRVDGQDNYHYAKRPGIPEFFIETKEYDRVIDNFGKVMVGHCRSKTIGDATLANAHPFAHGHICGVHNGTVRGRFGMERANDFGTDSEWLFWHASKYGMEATISEIPQDDAWSLVWWDAKEKELNFLRNKNRPLFFTHSDDMKLMLFASEPWMFGSFYRKFKLWEGGESGEKYYQLQEDKLHSFAINPHGKKSSEIFRITKIKDIKGKDRPVYQQGVRWEAGNRIANLGSTGNGGEVVRPFGKLDDEIPLFLPPSIRGETQGESGATPNAEEQSEKDSQNSSESSTPSTSSTNGKKPTLSLASSTSQNRLTDNKRNSSNGFAPRSPGFCELAPQNQYKPRNKRSTVRYIGNPGKNGKRMAFITDLNTSREFLEKDFFEITDGECCYCKKKTHNLSDVHEIFIRKRQTVRGPGIEEVTFICDSCLTPTIGHKDI